MATRSLRSSHGEAPGEPPYDWIGAHAAAKHLGIYYRTLYRRIDRGEVPAYRIGRLIRLRLHDLEGEPSRPPAPRVEPTGRILDTSSAAAYVGLSEFTFRPLVRSGEIPHSVVEQLDGRQHGWSFVDHDLHAWIETHRIRPGELRHLF